MKRVVAFLFICAMVAVVCASEAEIVAAAKKLKKKKTHMCLIKSRVRGSAERPVVVFEGPVGGKKACYNKALHDFPHATTPTDTCIQVWFNRGIIGGRYFDREYSLNKAFGDCLDPIVYKVTDDPKSCRKHCPSWWTRQKLKAVRWFLTKGFVATEYGVDVPPEFDNYVVIEVQVGRSYPSDMLGEMRDLLICLPVLVPFHFYVKLTINPDPKDVPYGTVPRQEYLIFERAFDWTLHWLKTGKEQMESFAFSGGGTFYADERIPLHNNPVQVKKILELLKGPTWPSFDPEKNNCQHATKFLLDAIQVTRGLDPATEPLMADSKLEMQNAELAWSSVSSALDFCVKNGNLEFPGALRRLASADGASSWFRAKTLVTNVRSIGDNAVRSKMSDDKRWDNFRNNVEGVFKKSSKRSGRKA